MKPKSKLCNTSAGFAEDYIVLEDALTHSHGPEGKHAHGVTAFTIGHSLTLALATLDLIRMDGDLIEFLIPLTIFVTAIANLFVRKQKGNSGLYYLRYAAALFFGLIHGLGFSNYLRSLLGSERGLVLPLFSFNVGIEVGQIIIVSLIMLLTKVVVDLLGLPKREWHVLLSGAGLGISLVLMLERFPF